MKISVDFGTVTGKIKPVHGVNNASRITNYGPLLDDFKKLQIPVSRLHDTGGTYGGTHYVDIPNIFPDFSADADCEDNYDFTLTDAYIKELIDNHIEVFYRLGVTIEHEPKKYNIYAPSDPCKWADICEHIVRHYNCGWANGYHWNIRFWEIWNEPDGLDPKVEPYGPPNWIGTAQDYYRLYSITANHLKKMHPDILVGGYSSCYILGANVNGVWTPGPTSFFTDFLAYISTPDTKAPLDFFTWHGYLGQQYLEKIETESKFVDETLNKYGFYDTLRIDAEWNCCICDIETTDRRTQQYINFRNEKGASHVAASLYEMQRLKVDMAMYYDTQLWCAYGALFHTPSLQPTKAYYAFLQFAELYRLGNHCMSTQEKNIYTCAAKDDYNMLAISNINKEDHDILVQFHNTSADKITIELLDKEHDLTETDCIPFTQELHISMPAYSFATLRIRKKTASP